jgi:hypothetical protein
MLQIIFIFGIGTIYKISDTIDKNEDKIYQKQ